MRAIGVVRRTETKHIKQCFRRENSCLCRLALQFLCSDGSAQRGMFFDFLRFCRGAAKDSARQIFGSVCFRRDAIGQAHAESSLQPCQQSHALEAAETQVAVKLRAAPQLRDGALTAQFFKQRAHDFQDALAYGGTVELCGGCRHRIPDGIRVFVERLPCGAFECHHWPERRSENYGAKTTSFSVPRLPSRNHAASALSRDPRPSNPPPSNRFPSKSRRPCPLR